MATSRANSKSSQVRKLLASGTSPADIAKKVGCTLGLVYNVKSRMAAGKGEGKPGRKRGRPAKGSSDLKGLGNLDGLVAIVRQQDQQRANLRTALERIRGIIDDVLA